MQFDDSTSGLLRRDVSVGDFQPSVRGRRLVRRVFRLGGRREARQVAADNGLVALHRFTAITLPDDARHDTAARRSDVLDFAKREEAVGPAACHGEGFLPVSVHPFAIIRRDNQTAFAIRSARAQVIELRANLIARRSGEPAVRVRRVVVGIGAPLPSCGKGNHNQQEDSPSVHRNFLYGHRSWPRNSLIRQE